MFSSNRWADVFMEAAGEDPIKALVCLKVFAAALKTVNDRLCGHNMAEKTENFLRKNIRGMPEAENIIRFICLLIEKNRFRYIDVLIERIEKLVDEKTGILDVTIESALPLESGFIEHMEETIKKTTGAEQIKIETKHTPEILGGYRLKIGGFCIDASIRGQLELMKTDLLNAAKELAGR